jgi:serine/threonine protein kinase
MLNSWPKAQEVACGLKYLHENNVVHGDIKIVGGSAVPYSCYIYSNAFQDNVLISDQGVAQISDFGIAQILGVQGYTTLTYRNVRYAAPELRPLSDDVHDVRPTFASDIFSLGIFLLQVRTHKLLRSLD